MEFKGRKEKMIRKALEGVKVADFTWVAAGPMITMFLADFGATVIHVETTKKPDPLRTAAPFKDKSVGINRSGFFAMFNYNKYGVTLNLDHPEGVKIAKKLIEWADIVVENFSPGTTQKWGLSYDDIKKMKPSIIMLSTSMQGQCGPRSSLPGFGSHLTSLSGFTHMTGWPDRMPVRPQSAYTDVIVPRFGAVALIASLLFRMKQDKGLYLDLSQFEAGLHFLAPVIMDYFVNGQTPHRQGNCHDYYVPHSAYPCKGEDKWCVIAVSTDEEWRALCDAMGNPPWTEDSQLFTAQGRKRNEERVDQHIAEWTRNLTALEIMRKLQRVGVAAGIVQDTQELYADPQLLHRHHFHRLRHPEMGEYTCNMPSFRLSRTPPEIERPAHCIGEHNEYVYTKILGIPDEEFIKFLSEGVFE